MIWDELLAGAALIRSAAVIAEPGLEHLPLAGIGWATVEHERAERELETALRPGERRGGPGSWEAIGRDPALGAAVWRYRDPEPTGRPELVVLEPDTEGRLAASLARFGESVAVIYLGEGAIRPGRVLRGGPAWGPHVVIL
jgi:hypothetical protein